MYRANNLRHCFSFLMIVGNFHVVGVPVPPHKANAPLVIDSDAVLPLPVTVQRLQPVARNGGQIPKFSRSIEHLELPKGRAFDGMKPPDSFAPEQPLRVTASEALDHADSV